MPTEINTETESKTKIELIPNPRDVMMAAIVDSSRSTRNESLKEDDDVLKGLEFTPGGVEVPAVVITPEVDVVATKPLSNLEEFENLPGDEDDVIPPKTEEITPPIVDKVDNPDILADTRIVSRDGVEYLKLPINGLDVEVPYADVVAKMQLTAPSPATDTLEPAVLDTALSDALLSSLTKLANGGEISEVVAELAPAVQAAANPLDEVAVKRIAKETTDEARRTENIDSAWAEFSNDPKYAELVKSPKVQSLLIETTGEVQSDQTFMDKNSESALGVFKEAGDRLISQMTEVLGGSIEVPPATVELEDKLNKKRDMPSTVSSRTVRQAVKVEPQPKTTTDIISGMAKSRGQTIY